MVNNHQLKRLFYLMLLLQNFKYNKLNHMYRYGLLLFLNRIKYNKDS